MGNFQRRVERPVYTRRFWWAAILSTLAVMACSYATQAQAQNVPRQCIQTDWRGNCTAWVEPTCEQFFRAGCPG